MEGDGNDKILPVLVLPIADRCIPKYHPPANIDKMASGEPLTDADRWDWLVLLREEALRRLLVPPQSKDETIIPSSLHSGVILTCSALKQKYRDVLRVASYYHPHIRVHFIYLKADDGVLLARVQARQGHYMKEDMVRSQFRSLEEPSSEEQALDCENVDVAATSVEVLELALTVVKERLTKAIAETTPT